MPFVPRSRSASPAPFGSHERMPSVSFHMPNEGDTERDSPSDDWYCPSPPRDKRPRFAFFPVETEAAAEGIVTTTEDTESEDEHDEWADWLRPPVPPKVVVAALDPLDEPVAFPHLAQKPKDAKRKSVQTVFYKDK